MRFQDCIVHAIPPIVSEDEEPVAPTIVKALNERHPQTTLFVALPRPNVFEFESVIHTRHGEALNLFLAYAYGFGVQQTCGDIWH